MNRDTVKEDMFTKNMHKVEVLSFFSIALLLVSPLFLASVRLYAQQSAENDQIPSDLSLDLALAQQNPAPDQRQIVQSETKQAYISINIGATIPTALQDTVAPTVKTESKKNAVNPDQTTSEQVVTVPVEIQVDQNGTPVPTEGTQNQGSTNTTGNQPTTQSTGIQSEDGITGAPTQTQNFVPGTNVLQPDDNAAPSDNSGNPNLPAPTQPVENAPIPGETTPVTSPSSGDNGAQPTSNSQQNTIPLESQPQTTPASGDTNPTSAPDQSQPSDSSTTASPDQSNDTNATETTSVQGAATGPSTSNPIVFFFQNIKLKIMHIFSSSK